MATAHRPQRRPTLEDVAARAGVSRALVSIVMRGVPGASEATRLRVAAVASEIGYRPDGRARLLASTRSGLIGVTLSLNNPFQADVVEGVYAAAESLGYQVVLSAICATRSPARATESLLAYRCEAAILVGAVVRGRVLADVAAQLPVVVVGQPSRQPGVDVVRADDVAGMRMAVDHLVDLGHRTIVHVDGGRAPGAAARRAGFLAAMKRRRLAGEGAVVTGGEGEEDGARAARTLLASGLPDAVVTYNDRSAVGLLDVFAREDVAVPGAISVVGYDDSRIARRAYLQLTTISQDIERLAWVAVQQAAARIEGGTPTQREQVLLPHLVSRSSTAPRRPAG